MQCLKGLHSTAQHSAAQHSTAQHSPAQHSTAQHSTAQHRMPYILALELVDHEGTPAVAHEVHVRHPNPVLGDLGPCDQEAGEEEQDRDISWQSSVCCVHIGGDSRNQISQHCAANVSVSLQYYSLHKVWAVRDSNAHKYECADKCISPPFTLCLIRNRTNRKTKGTSGRYTAASRTPF